MELLLSTNLKIRLSTLLVMLDYDLKSPSAKSRFAIRAINSLNPSQTAQLIKLMDHNQFKMYKYLIDSNPVVLNVYANNDKETDSDDKESDYDEEIDLEKSYLEFMESDGGKDNKNKSDESDLSDEEGVTTHYMI